MGEIIRIRDLTTETSITGNIYIPVDNVTYTGFAKPKTDPDKAPTPMAA